MKIPFKEEKLNDHLANVYTDYNENIDLAVIPILFVSIFVICLGVLDVFKIYTVYALLFLFLIFFTLIIIPSVIDACDNIKEAEQYQKLTKELLAYMKEKEQTYFTWKELEKLLSISRFAGICDKSFWSKKDENDRTGMEKYIHWLAESSCFPELGGTYGEEVYFTKKGKKKEKHSSALTPMENNEDDPLAEAYQLLCGIFSDAPKSLAKQASQLQTDLKLLCDLVAYNGTQGVDIHKVYTYYIPSLTKTYQKYLRLRRMKAPALEKTKQELLASMQTLHEALSILCERISKVNQNDLSVELVTLRNVIAADGLKKEDLCAS